MELPSANTSEKRLSPPFCNLPPLWCCSKASSLPLQYPPRVWQLRVGLPEDTISFFEEFGRMDIEDLQWNMHNLFRLIASSSLKLAVFWVRVLEIKRPKKLDKLSENIAVHHHDILVELHTIVNQSVFIKECTWVSIFKSTWKVRVPKTNTKPKNHHYLPWSYIRGLKLYDHGT